jgi:hypothetical protein
MKSRIVFKNIWKTQSREKWTLFLVRNSLSKIKEYNPYGQRLEITETKDIIAVYSYN